MRDVQSFLRPCQPHITKPTLLFELIGLGERTHVREHAVFKTNQHGDRKLQPLRPVQRHEDHGCLVVVERVSVDTTCIKSEGLFGSNLGAQEACQTITSYRYTQSWFMVLCEGPIKAIPRVWADGKLILDTSGSGNPVSSTCG